MTKGSIPEDKIDEIKRRINIVDLVSGFVSLKQAGRNFSGLCPFHKEKTPSFTVSPDKQIFYCFGCGEGGNALAFVMKINGLTFPEAIRYLAKKTGVSLPERSLSRQEKEQLTLKERMLRLHALVSDYYLARLRGKDCQKAQTYLQNRDIGDESVNTFQLGYSLEGWRFLRDYLEQKRVPLPLAEQSGLLVKNERGEYYDRFRGRLIFPIEDQAGQIIAFGGRILGEGEPKYLNSPESALFSKGKNLYGLSRTKEDIRKSGYAILVEGYFDLLSLWNAGVKNVVATLGTALTRDHVDLLRRYTKDVAVVFDGDEAGKKALARSLGLFIDGNLHTRAVMLPEASDPDDYVRNFGKKRFLELIEKSPPAVEYYLDTVVGSRGDFDHNRGALREALSFIARMDNDAERDLFIKLAAERIGVDEAILKAEVIQGMGKKPNETVLRKNENRSSSPVDALEMNFITLILAHPDKIPAMIDADILKCFGSDELRNLGKIIETYYGRSGKIDLKDFVDHLEAGSLRDGILSRLINSGAWEADTVDQVFSDMIHQIRRKWFKEKKRYLSMRLVRAQQGSDPELWKRLLVEKEDLMKIEKAVLSKG
ncbi:MAG: DNA primase [Syntrophus sp. (in: bacteria)]